MSNYATTQNFTDLSNINNNIPDAIIIDESDIPTTVNATYTVDLNILRIHESIRFKYAALRGSIPKLTAKIVSLNNKIRLRSTTLIDKNVYTNNIRELESLINDYTNGTSWTEYI